MIQINKYTKIKKSQLNDLSRLLIVTFTTIRNLIIASTFLFQSHALAQRFNYCDSTFHQLNADTMVIAGRKHLYFQTGNTTTVFHDFSTTNSDEYLRDFEIVKPSLWYAVIGTFWLGTEGKLYKSLDRGQTWTIDTNHYAATNTQFLPSGTLPIISNLQHLNGDTLLMFVGYYHSAILYSVDLGLTWKKWFDNQITYYQGMLECNDKYYIFSYQGDGFSAAMFGFNKNLLFTSDSAGLWTNYNLNGYHPACYQGNNADCIYAAEILGCGIYSYFKNYVDSICSTFSGIEVIDKSAYDNLGIIYPNPFNGTITIKGALGAETYNLNNLFGHTVWSGKHIEEQEFYYLPSGIYFLTIVNGPTRQTLKIIRE